MKRSPLKPRKPRRKQVRGTNGWQMIMLCACGCGRQRGVQAHHVVYQQELRRRLLTEHRAAGHVGPPDLMRELAVLGDTRNFLALGPDCHANHHNRSRPLSLAKLRDENYEFAAEFMGEGAAFEYLRRRYSGADARLDNLIDVVTA